MLKELETVLEGSRELDAQIAVSLKFPTYKYPKAVLHRKPNSWCEAWERLTHDGYGRGAPLPHYTTSVDVVLTLVPEGCGWSLNMTHGQYQALIFQEGEGVVGRGDAATPALALLAAVLQAGATITSRF